MTISTTSTSTTSAVTPTTTPNLYLASKSPRRRELLDQIGVAYQVVEVDVPEVRQAGELPQNYVERLSQDKASAGARCHAGRLTLGADTIVVLGEQVLEKPQSEEHGIEMLLQLAGQTHQVMTAVTLVEADRMETRLSVSQVSFGPVSYKQAQAYWQTGEPADKAGGYGIQGRGGIFVQSIQGSYSGIVGLPLYETVALLEGFNIPV